MGSIGIAGCDLNHRGHRESAGGKPVNNENSVTAVLVAIRRIAAADWWPLPPPADTPRHSGPQATGAARFATPNLVAAET
jgi:hypothetical protein